MSKKRDILKQVFSGKLPKESLNPPVFEIKHMENGIFEYLIGGVSVDRDHFFAEQDRLHVSRFDTKFDITFRND